ncbi:MAG: type I glyceraldehyde-3-phosphate dehydrogenase [Thermoanaerobacteraceae bacterium]|nr:type I glyceraldehyde-3-phosphate dehydrogenase [Thermoanaerobacteraceae bacterium]
MASRVAINGLGRIGTNILRIIFEHGDDIELVAVNSTGNLDMHAHLLKYDSTYGVYKGDIGSNEKAILIDGKEIQYFQEKDPRKLPWKDLNIDIVVESSGKFNTRDEAYRHIEAGAKNVIITSPSDDADAVIVMGVNQEICDPEKHKIISASSCTTNCIAPIVKVIDERFHIIKGSMTTVHSYTSDQRLLDKSHKDFRRARAANLSIIPTTTGAAKSIGTVLPELQGKLNGISIRVPTPTVSLVDLSILTSKQTNVVELNNYLKKMATEQLNGVMSYCEKPLVSIDFKGDPHSAIIDSLSTMVIDGNMVKILAWYDNEYGYSNRVIDLIKYITLKRD